MSKEKPDTARTIRRGRKMPHKMKKTKLSKWKDMLGNRHPVVVLHRLHPRQIKQLTELTKHKALEDAPKVKDEPPMENDAECLPVSAAALEVSCKEMTLDDHNTSKVSESKNNTWTDVIKKELKVTLTDIAPYVNIMKLQYKLIKNEHDKIPEPDNISTNSPVVTDIKPLVPANCNKETIGSTESWSDDLSSKTNKKSMRKSKLHSEDTEGIARKRKIKKKEVHQSETYQPTEDDISSVPLSRLVEILKLKSKVKKVSLKNSISKNQDTSIVSGSISDVSSTFDFDYDSMPEFQDPPNFGKGEAVTKVHCYNDEPKSKMFGENQGNKVRSRQSASKSETLDCSLKKPVELKTIRVSLPYNLSMLNNHQVKEKTPVKTVQEAKHSRISGEKGNTPVTSLQSKSETLEGSQKKPELLKNIRVSLPYNPSMLNNHQVKEKTPVKTVQESKNSRISGEKGNTPETRLQSKSETLEGSLKKPELLKNIRVSLPYNLSMLNNHQVKEKIPVKTVQEGHNSRISGEKGNTPETSLQSKSETLEDSLKKPVVLKNIRVSPPYNLGMLNNHQGKKKTPVKTVQEAKNSRISVEKGHTPKTSLQSKTISLGTAKSEKRDLNSVEDLNVEKPVRRRLFTLDINQPQKDKEKIEKKKSTKDTCDNVIQLNSNDSKSSERTRIHRDVNQITTLTGSSKDPKTITAVSPRNIPQKSTETSAKSRVSDSHTSTSSKTCEQLRSLNHDYCSDSTLISEDDNNNKVHSKRKFQDSASSDSCKQMSANRVKLKRTNRHIIKSNGVAESTKDTKILCSEKAQNIPQTRPESSPKSQASDTQTSTSSETCEKLRSLAHDRMTDTNQIIGDGNNNKDNPKRKYQGSVSSSSIKENSPKRVKLKRTNGLKLKSNYVSENCSSTSESLTSTRLLSPLNDMSTSTERTADVRDLGPKSIGFGQPVSKALYQSCESLTITEVGTVASDLSASQTPTSTSENSGNSYRRISGAKCEAGLQIPVHKSEDLRISGAKCEAGLQIPVHKSEDLRFGLNEKVMLESPRSVKCRLGPPIIRESKIDGSESRVDIKSGSSVKSRLGIVRNTTKSGTESNPSDQQSNESSPSTDQINNMLNLRDTKKFANYRIPKISQDSLNDRTTSTQNKSQNSKHIVETENNDDDDYIDLHPDDSFSEFDAEFDDDESKTTSSYTAQTFSMTDSVFDRFMKKNQSDFNAQYENIQQETSRTDWEKEKNYSPSKSTLTFQRNNIQTPPSVMKIETDPFAFQPPIGTINQNRFKTEDSDYKEQTFVQLNYFKGICFGVLKRGKCYKRHTCAFEHNVSPLFSRMLSETNADFLELIKFMASFKYNYFLKNLYKDKLSSAMTVSEILQMLRTLYNFQDVKIDKQMFEWAIDAVIAQQVTLKEFITDLLTFLTDDSTKLSLFYAIKERTKTGDLWDTTKDLVLSIKYLSLNVFEAIVTECMEFRPENATDINATLVTSLSSLFLGLVKRDVMARFNQAVKETAQTHINASLTMSSQSNDMPVSPTGVTNQDQININNCLQDYNIISASSPLRTNTSNVLDRRKQHSVTDDNIVNVETCSSFVVQKIDELPRRKSVFRDRFTKFYRSLDVLRDALNQGNYSAAIKILEHAWNAQQDETIYTLSCYRRLCQEIKLSAHHVNTIRWLTVETNVDFAFRKRLADIAKCVLIRLADEGLYVFAYSVFENWKELLDLNASLVLLAAEIYLANDLYLEGFFLLKRYNIIHSNREKWKISSDRRDECVRAKLLSLLLISLSTTYSNYALFLWEFLAQEQSSSFEPIDLTRYSDMVISSVLLTGEVDLIVHAARLIFKYDISLRPITYRALIVRVISEDVLLAKQLYQNGMGRGIYSSVKFRRVTHIVVDPNWTYEEIYLAFEELINDVLINIGPGLDRISPRQLAIYIVIEALHSHTSSALNKDSYDAWSTFRACRNLIADVLASRFDPPLKLLFCRIGKIQKLQPTNLVNYLKAGHLSVNTLNNARK